MLRLERDVWAMVKWLRQATDEYNPPIRVRAEKAHLRRLVCKEETWRWCTVCISMDGSTQQRDGNRQEGHQEEGAGEVEGPKHVKITLRVISTPATRANHCHLPDLW